MRRILWALLSTVLFFNIGCSGDPRGHSSRGPSNSFLDRVNEEIDEIAKDREDQISQGYNEMRQGFKDFRKDIRNISKGKFQQGNSGRIYVLFTGHFDGVLNEKESKELKRKILRTLETKGDYEIIPEEEIRRNKKLRRNHVGNKAKSIASSMLHIDHGVLHINVYKIVYRARGNFKDLDSKSTVGISFRLYNAFKPRILWKKKYSVHASRKTKQSLLDLVDNTGERTFTDELRGGTLKSIFVRKLVLQAVNDQLGNIPRK